MKYLGHYLIHHAHHEAIDIATELGTILDENNVASGNRYAFSDFEMGYTMLNGIRFYSRVRLVRYYIERPISVFTEMPDTEPWSCNGLDAYFTWELRPSKGYTLTTEDKSAGRPKSVWDKHPSEWEVNHG